MYFYQIAGFRAHSDGWFKLYDNKPTMDAIAAETSKLFRPGGPESPIELVLGILPSGASYVLMTTEQMLSFTHKYRLRIPRHKSPWRATDFLSLSPIYFHSIHDLSAKLNTYKERPRNKNRRDVEEREDNSTANRGYVKTKLQAEHYRAYFEHQRVLYGLVRSCFESEKFALQKPYWFGGPVRIVSLVFGEWTVDKRPREQRLGSPMILEVGWTDASLPQFLDSSSASPVHVNIKSSLANPNSKRPAFSQIEDTDEEGMYARLRSLFEHDTNASGALLVLLVHDEAMARAVLSRAGVDVGSYSSGLAHLLTPKCDMGNSKMGRLSRSRSPQRSAGPSHPPPRNRSPPPYVKYEEGEIAPSQDAASAPAACIVDIQKLVRAVMELNPGLTVAQSAKVLRMQTDTKSCAGDDSLLQLHMWKSMAEGLAIDEQHKQRVACEPERADWLVDPSAQRNESCERGLDQDPNDMDPNDAGFDPNDAPQPPTAPRPIMHAHIEGDFSDDDW